MQVDITDGEELKNNQVLYRRISHIIAFLLLIINGKPYRVAGVLPLAQMPKNNQSCKCKSKFSLMWNLNLHSKSMPTGRKNVDLFIAVCYTFIKETERQIEKCRGEAVWLK